MPNPLLDIIVAYAVTRNDFGRVVFPLDYNLRIRLCQYRGFVRECSGLLYVRRYVRVDPIDTTDLDDIPWLYCALYMSESDLSYYDSGYKNVKEKCETGSIPYHASIAIGLKKFWRRCDRFRVGSTVRV